MFSFTNEYFYLCFRFFFFSLQAAKKVRPARKANRQSKNPLKALANRQDLRSEYEEVRSDVADKEMKRIKREQSKEMNLRCLANRVCIAFFVFFFFETQLSVFNMLCKGKSSDFYQKRMLKVFDHSFLNNGLISKIQSSADSV